MKLTKYLRDMGYDLIEGPARNHKPLQIWLKQPFNEAELYYTDINHAFKSPVSLTITEDAALSVDATKNDSYGFNLGLSVLEELLKPLGIGNFEISSNIKGGKKVTISYNNSVTKIIPLGDITNYLSSADFKHPNPVLLKNANRNNLILITGVVFAKNLVVDFETDDEISANLVASLNKEAGNNLNFSMKSRNELNMVAARGDIFPIAIKASSIDFDKGVFKGLTLITDNRNLF